MKVSQLRENILKALVITVPFGWINLLPLPYSSVTFVLLYAYFLLAFAAFPATLSRGALRFYGWPLLAMWVLMLWSTVMDGGLVVFGSWSNLRQIIFFAVFFIFAVPDINRLAQRGKKVEEYILIASVGMVIIYFAGFTVADQGSDRTSLRGVNSNVVALYSAISAVILLDISVRGPRTGFGKLWRRSALPLAAVLIYILMKTGSRGGVIIFAVGVFIYFIGWKRLTLPQMIALYFSAPVALGIVWLLFTSGPVAERFSSMSTDIRVSTLWPTAIEIIRNYPLFGAGFDRTSQIVSMEAGRNIALHNEILKIATASGLIGLGLFGLFISRLGRQAYRYRANTGSALRFSLLAILLLQLAKGGGALQLPFVWLVFLLLASAPISWRRASETEGNRIATGGGVVREGARDGKIIAE